MGFRVSGLGFRGLGLGLRGVRFRLPTLEFLQGFASSHDSAKLYEVAKHARVTDMYGGLED